MRTAAFVIFAVVTAAAAALSTLVASRYLSLERDLADARSRLEDSLYERKRQEEEKIALRLERERVQSDLEARLAGQLAQLESCEAKRREELLEIAATLKILQKAVIDIQVQVGAVPGVERDGGSNEAGKTPASSEGGSAGSVRKTLPAATTDVPKGAIPSPEEEAKKLDKVQ
ncbi:MAG: hypothetical protein ACOZEN_04115 [Thermodesulfobacteriota bacterium]